MIAGQLAEIDIGRNLLTFGLTLLGVINTYLLMRARHDQKPNNGTTTRDAINRIEQHSAAVAVAVVPPDVLATLPQPPPTPPAGTPVTK